MIGYVTIGVSDMEKAKAFYSALLADLGAGVMMDMGRIAFIGAGGFTTRMLLLQVSETADEQNPKSARRPNSAKGVSCACRSVSARVRSRLRYICLVTASAKTARPRCLLSCSPYCLVSNAAQRQRTPSTTGRILRKLMFVV